MIRKVLYSLIVLFLLFCFTALVLFFTYARRIPRLPDDLRILGSSPPTEVYARSNEVLTSMGGRSYIPFERISPDFIKAIIATEDKRFYRHHGIDFAAICRATWTNILKGRGPGASTITQQLAKNMFFTFRRSWERKLLEGLASLAIEDAFSKEQILEAYSNLVYFGRFAYGVENASITYFGKHALELELHEAAMLAGLPNSPSRFNPINNLDLAKLRQRHVLNRMAKVGFITESAVDSAASIYMIFNLEPPQLELASYPVDYAIETSSRLLGKDIIQYGGVKILTTIDPVLQKYAEQALSSGLNELEPRLETLEDSAETRLEGVVLAIEVATGQIVAMVGGRNYRESTFNRAVYAFRHPGSSFKPVTYLTALEKTSITPASMFEDKKITLAVDKRRTWSPGNFDNIFRGPMTLKYGLMLSINTIAAQLMGEIGPGDVVKTAHRLGVNSNLEPLLALSLGAQSVTPIDMAAIYSTIARLGDYIEPHLVKRVESRGRDLLYENLVTSESRFAPETVYELLDMLQSALNDGTGKTVRRRGFKGNAFGKTGTSSEFRDSWFCGATPTLAAVVWIGYDDNRPMYFKGRVGVTGATAAAPVWAEFMIRATAGEPARKFQRPSGIRTLFMHPVSGAIDIIPQQEDWIPVALKEGDAERLLLARSAANQTDTSSAGTADTVHVVPSD